MTTQTLTFSDHDARERVQHTLAYFHKRRVACIRAYRSAVYVVQRNDARANTLHYGRLARMMEAGL